MAARSALASASVSPNGLTAEPTLSSLPVPTSRAWTAPSPSVNSITTRHRITLSPDCLPPAKAYHPQVLDGLTPDSVRSCMHRPAHDRLGKPRFMHKTIRTPTLEIAYLESGPADGTPIILMHG